MTARVQKTSASEQISATSKSTDSITNLPDLSSSLEVIDSAYPQGSLPADRFQGSINWLGSSYSGVDIKVIAHLYTPYESSIAELERLENNSQLYAAIADGASSLLGASATVYAILTTGGTTTYTQKRDVFKNATGLNNIDPIEQKASDFLFSRAFESAHRGADAFRQSMTNLHVEYSAQAEKVQTRLSELKRIEANAQSTVSLGTLQTLSIQTHREKFEVRALGSSHARGVTRGQRTIAGSMIFTLFNEHSLASLMRAMGSEAGVWKNREISTLFPDQLPPIDITIAFANEYGSLSEMRIFGVEFVNDGMTMSIEDILTEQILNFIARDCDVITSRGNVLLSRLQRGVADASESEVSASSLLFNNTTYNQYLDRIGVRRKLVNR